MLEGVAIFIKKECKYIHMLLPSNWLPHVVEGIFEFFGLEVDPSFESFWFVPNV